MSYANFSVKNWNFLLSFKFVECCREVLEVCQFLNELAVCNGVILWGIHGDILWDRISIERNAVCTGSDEWNRRGRDGGNEARARARREEYEKEKYEEQNEDKEEEEEGEEAIGGCQRPQATNQPYLTP